LFNKINRYDDEKKVVRFILPNDCETRWLSLCISLGEFKKHQVDIESVYNELVEKEKKKNFF